MTPYLRQRVTVQGAGSQGGCSPSKAKQIKAKRIQRDMRGSHLRSATKRCTAAVLNTDECAMTVQERVPMTWLLTLHTYQLRSWFAAEGAQGTTISKAPSRKRCRLSSSPQPPAEAASCRTRTTDIMGAKGSCCRA